MFLLLKIVANEFPDIEILCVLVLLKLKYNGTVGTLDQ